MAWRRRDRHPDQGPRSVAAPSRARSRKHWDTVPLARLQTQNATLFGALQLEKLGWVDHLHHHDRGGLQHRRTLTMVVTDKTREIASSGHGLTPRIRGLPRQGRSSGGRYDLGTLLACSSRMSSTGRLVRIDPTSISSTVRPRALLDVAVVIAVSLAWRSSRRSILPCRRGLVPVEAIRMSDGGQRSRPALLEARGLTKDYVGETGRRSGC